MLNIWAFSFFLKQELAELSQHEPQVEYVQPSLPKSKVTDEMRKGRNQKTKHKVGKGNRDPNSNEEMQKYLQQEWLMMPEPSVTDEQNEGLKATFNLQGHGRAESVVDHRNNRLKPSIDLQGSGLGELAIDHQNGGLKPSIDLQGSGLGEPAIDHQNGGLKPSVDLQGSGLGEPAIDHQNEGLKPSIDPHGNGLGEPEENGVKTDVPGSGLTASEGNGVSTNLQRNGLAETEGSKTTADRKQVNEKPKNSLVAVERKRRRREIPGLFSNE